MDSNTAKIVCFLEKAEARLFAWLQDKPTGKFSFEISVNQGGLRDKPQISIAEKLK